MQRADESTGARPQAPADLPRVSDDEQRGPESEANRRAVLVFLGLLAVVAVIVAVGVVSTREGDQHDVAIPRQTTLSEPQAIQELELLSARVNEAFGERSLSQLPSIYTATSPVLPIAQREIRQLLNDDVVNQSVYESLEISIVSLDPNEIVLREQTRITPKFINEEGRDVTSNPKRILQTVRWTLRSENGLWQIHDSVVESSELVEDRK